MINYLYGAMILGPIFGIAYGLDVDEHMAICILSGFLALIGSQQMTDDMADSKYISLHSDGKYKYSPWKCKIGFLVIVAISVALVAALGANYPLTDPELPPLKYAIIPGAWLVSKILAPEPDETDVALAEERLRKK